MRNTTSLLRKIILLTALLFIAMPSAIYAQQSESDTTDVQADLMRRYEYFLLEAVRQRQLGNHDSAAELLSHCLYLNPNSDVALYEMAKYKSFLQEDSVAEEYLERAVELAPDNYWYSTALVNIYFKEGRIDEAITVVENLSKKYPGKSDLLLMLMDLYTRNEDYPNVIKTLDRLEVKEGKSEQISTEKFRIYVQMKDEKRAYEEIMNLAKEYPNDLRYKVLLGDMYVQHGHMDKAYEVYKAAEKEDSTNLNVMVSLADFYSKQKQDSLYQKQIEKLVLNTHLSNDMRVQIMTNVVYENLANKGDSTKVLEKFRKILSYPQENSDMTELCVRYMVSIQMPPDSIKPVLKALISIDPENEDARNQLLSYAVQEDDTAEIFRICKPAVDIATSDPIYYYFLGIIYYQREEPQMAIQTLRKGLDNVKEDTQISIISNSYTLLGDLYHDLGDDEKAFEAYDSCLIYTPNDVGALNNYAYYLSLKNQDLERAEQMSAKTLVQEPDNYTYIDTYAWILFMLERYDEAKVQIDKALEVMGDDISADDSNIVEHAGDIYYKTGDKDGALRLWQKAKDLGSDSKTLEKKLKRKKYIAE